MFEGLLTPQQEARLPFAVGGEYGYPAEGFASAVDAATAAVDVELLEILDRLGNASATQDHYGLANGESHERRAARVALAIPAGAGCPRAVPTRQGRVPWHTK